MLNMPSDFEQWRIKAAELEAQREHEYVDRRFGDFTSRLALEPSEEQKRLRDESLGRKSAMLEILETVKFCEWSADLDVRLRYSQPDKRGQ
jgi:hypothetical protein